MHEFGLSNNMKPPGISLLFDLITRKTTMRCIECGVGFCAPQTGRKCWENHVRNEGSPDSKRQKNSDESM